MDKKKLASYIDHTLLKPDASIADIKKICQEAAEYSFASVCINPYYIKAAKSFLENTGVKTCTVVGFPLGATTLEVKLYEAEQAIKHGADEIDMVINIGALKENNFDYTAEEIKKMSNVCNGKALLKIIIETCLLEKEQIVASCRIAASAGANYVKTSTGFSLSGATISDVKLMKETVGDLIGIKASGGIKDLKTMLMMIEAGATRIGTSSSVKIINEII